MTWLSVQSSKLVSHLESKIHIPWIVASGCCRVELENASSSTYDWKRLGVEDVAVHPSESDLLIVAGWINPELQREIESAYNHMSGRKSVIAVGACALSGSPYKVRNGKITVSDIVPVDVFVPGCPPKPESILDAIRLLKEKILPGPDQRTVLHEALKDAPRT